MTAFNRGFTRGTRFARNVAGTKDIRFKSLFENMPTKDLERIDWLNGFAAGVKHVAYDMRLNYGREEE